MEEGMGAVRSVRDVIDGQILATIASGATAAEAARLLVLRGIGALPVVDEEALLGIVTERDLVRRVIAADRDPKATLVADVMTPDPATVTPDAAMIEAVLMMREGGFRHMPVVFEGRLVGIVSLRDAFSRDIVRIEEFEEIRDRMAQILR